MGLVGSLSATRPTAAYALVDEGALGRSENERRDRGRGFEEKTVAKMMGAPKGPGACGGPSRRDACGPHRGNDAARAGMDRMDWRCLGRCLAYCPQFEVISEAMIRCGVSRIWILTPAALIRELLRMRCGGKGGNAIVTAS